MKSITLILIALLILPAVMAAEAYDLSSFEDEAEQAIELDEKDAVRFNLLDGRHQLTLHQVGRNGHAKIKIFPFIDLDGGSESWFAPLAPSRVAQGDLDKDDLDDIMIRVLKTNEEEKTATLLITSIEHKYGKKEGFVGEVIETEPDPVEDDIKWEELRPYIVIGAVIVAILAVILVRKREKNSKKKAKK